MDFPFLDGALLALSIVTSIGPVSMKCIYSGLAFGRPAAAVASLGGGTVHGIFAGLAGAGARGVELIVADHADFVRFASALVLIGLGIRVLLKRQATRTEAQPAGLHAAYLSTAATALANPMTILPYAAAAPSLTGFAGAQPATVLQLAVGAASGAAVWYLLLGCVVTLVPRAWAARALPRLNVLAGITQMGFGLLVYFR